jgi:hypothetical protein
MKAAELDPHLAEPAVSARSGERLLKLEAVSWSPRHALPHDATKTTKALRAAVLRRAVSLAATVAAFAADAVATAARRHETRAKQHQEQRQVP